MKVGSQVQFSLRACTFESVYLDVLIAEATELIPAEIAEKNPEHCDINFCVTLRAFFCVLCGEKVWARLWQRAMNYDQHINKI